MPSRTRFVRLLLWEGIGLQVCPHPTRVNLHGRCRSLAAGVIVFVALAGTLANAQCNLGMEVIAEGAETTAQIELLTSMKCDCVQGYIFSKPIERAAVELLLNASPGLLFPLKKGAAQS